MSFHSGFMPCPVHDQVMSVPASYLMTWRTSDAAIGGQANYPPTVFVHMERDQDTAAGVAEDIAVLKKLVRVPALLFVC